MNGFFYFCALEIHWQEFRFYWVYSSVGLEYLSDIEKVRGLSPRTPTKKINRKSKKPSTMTNSLFIFAVYGKLPKKYLNFFTL